MDTFYSCCNVNTVLDKVKVILDLAILLDQRLNFQDNISMIANKAYGILGYMKHCSNEFVHPYLIKILFFLSSGLSGSMILSYGAYK